MSEEGIPETPKKEDQLPCSSVVKKPALKSKRDIVRFVSETLPMAINLEHVNCMYVQGNRVTFEFYTKSQYIDFADENVAKSIFDVLLNMWAGDVVE